MKGRGEFGGSKILLVLCVCRKADGRVGLVLSTTDCSLGNSDWTNSQQALICNNIITLSQNLISC